jgi:DnaK suppressor protein
LYFFRILNTRMMDMLPGARGVLSSLVDEGERPEPMDDADITSILYAKEYVMRMHNRNRSHILEIRKALERIKEGDFGVCEVCGDDIGVERLKAQPTTTVCVNCKRREESVKGLKVA